jgi:dihydroflavonol-4-reductase
VWRGHAEGLNAVVVSPSIVLGPWTKLSKGSMGFFSFVNRTSKFYTGGTMGYVDVKDVVAIMLRLMKENRFNERYIASSENISFKEIYSDVARSLNKPLPSIKLNSFTLKAFAMFHNISAPEKISSTMIEHATGVHIFSNKKICDALPGYTFAPVKQTIEQTAKFYLDGLAK